MRHLEASVEPSNQNTIQPTDEKRTLIATSRKSNLIILSRSKEGVPSHDKKSDELRPLNLNLSKTVIERLKKVLEKNGGNPEKTATHLGVPERWIHAAMQKYKLC